jgi:hypothetical protein
MAKGSVRDTVPSTSDQDITTVNPSAPVEVVLGLAAQQAPEQPAESGEELTVTKTAEHSADLIAEMLRAGQGEEHGDDTTAEAEEEPTGTEHTVRGVQAYLIGTLPLPPRDEHTMRLPTPPVRDGGARPVEGEPPPSEQPRSTPQGPAPQEPARAPEESAYTIPGIGANPKWLRPGALGAAAVATLALAIHIATPSSPVKDHADGGAARVPRSVVVDPVGFAAGANSLSVSPSTPPAPAPTPVVTEDDPLGEQVSRPPPRATPHPAPFTAAPVRPSRAASPPRTRGPNGLVRDTPF